jgi:hypothetical protein
MLKLGMLNRSDSLLAQRNIRPGRHFRDLWHDPHLKPYPE